MPFSLINNIQSQTSQTSLARTSANLAGTIQRLSSGLRINNSGDDAAGLAIANKYRSDIATLSQGIRNANDGVSALQILDGGLNTISNLLDRATTLATQSASDSFTGDRDTLNNELSKVTAEITRQAKNIGLASTAGADSRFNKALSVFIGGGVDASGATNTVGVNLSGAANQVDAIGLGLNALNIGATAIPTSATTFTAATAIGTSTATTAAGSTVTSAAVSTVATGPNALGSTTTTAVGSTITTAAVSTPANGAQAVPGAGITANEALTFTGVGGGTFTVNLTAGDDADAIVSAINLAAGNTFGVIATNNAGVIKLDSTGESYDVSSNQLASNVNQSGLDGASVIHTAVNTIAADETLTFTVGASNFTVALKQGDSVDAIASKINNASGNTYGILATNDNGKVSLTLDVTNASAASFSIASTVAASVTSSGLAGASVTFGSYTGLAQSEQLTFTGANGSVFSVNLAAGDDGAAVASKINAIAGTVNTFGVQATNTAGVLTLSSTGGSYSVTSNRSAGDATQSGLGGLQVVRTAANTITSDETLTFHVGSAQFNVGLKVGDSVDQIVAKINSSSSNTYGITASNVAGQVSLTLDVTNPNAADFTVTSDKAAAVTNTGLNNLSVAYSPTSITLDENLTFTVGSNTFNVALKAGDKAADIVSKINNATGNIYGIVASFTSGASPRLVLTSDVTNAKAASFTVASDQTGAGSTKLDGAAVTDTTASGGVAGATSAINAIKAAIATLGKVQGAVGAGQNNLMQAIDLATSQTTNFQAAESRLRDADVSAEASNMSRLTVLQQAGVAALAQANQMSQAVLTLLR
jgi:flagellin